MVKYGGATFVFPLVKLFNSILHDASFPAVWNVSLILSLFKKDDPNGCNNYRGISLCSSLGKLFISLLN